MNRAEAIEIIRALANGADPATGELFPASSPYQRKDILCALSFALGVLDSAISISRQSPSSIRTRRPDRKLEAASHDRAGESWDETEDAKLSQEFDEGFSVADISKAHGRTRGAIKSRLVKIGKVADRNHVNEILDERERRLA